MTLTYSTVTKRWSLWQGRRYVDEFDGDADLLQYLEGRGSRLLSLHANDLFACFYQGLTLKEPTADPDSARLAALVEGLRDWTVDLRKLGGTKMYCERTADKLDALLAAHGFDPETQDEKAALAGGNAE